MRKRKLADFSKDLSLKGIVKLDNLSSPKIDESFAHKGWNALSDAFKRELPQNYAIPKTSVESSSALNVQNCSSPVTDESGEIQIRIDSPVHSQDELANIDDCIENSVKQCPNRSPVFNKPYKSLDICGAFASEIESVLSEDLSDNQHDFLTDVHSTTSDAQLEISENEGTSVCSDWKDSSDLLRRKLPQSFHKPNEQITDSSIGNVQDCDSPFYDEGGEIQARIESPVQSQQGIAIIDEDVEFITTQCSNHSKMLTKPCENSTDHNIWAAEIESLLSEDSSAIQHDSVADVQSLCSTVSDALLENSGSDQGSISSEWISPVKNLRYQMKGSEWLQAMTSVFTLPSMSKTKTVERDEISKDFVKKFDTMKGGFAEQLKNLLTCGTSEVSTSCFDVEVKVTNLKPGGAMLVADATLLASKVEAHLDLLPCDTLGVVLDNRVVHAWLICEGSVLHIKPPWHLLHVSSLNKLFMLCPHVVDVRPPECRTSGESETVVNYSQSCAEDLHCDPPPR